MTVTNVFEGGLLTGINEDDEMVIHVCFHYLGLLTSLTCSLLQFYS